MSAECEKVSVCPFFAKNWGTTEIIKHQWIQNYCRDLKNSENCERKKFMKQTGDPPPDNMAPNGELLV